MKKKGFVFISFTLFMAIVMLLATKSYDLDSFAKYTMFLPNYDIRKYPPKTIMFSSMTSEYLIDHAKEIKQQQGLDGFILNQLPASQWPGRYEEMVPLTDIIHRGNKASADAGMHDNFLKIALNKGSLPMWDDQVQWEIDFKELTKVAAWAKEVGFRGIALDTESYHKGTWDNGKKKNDIPNIKRIIKNYGQKTVEAILAGYPDAEILVFPIGNLYAYTNSSPNNYYYWIDYFNGMLNAKAPQGINLLSERTYYVANQFKLKSYYSDIKGEIIADFVDDPEYWLTKCSIGFGMWPLGKEDNYNDKKANLTPQEFFVQYNTALQYCPKYVWIFAHGLSWWQTDQGEKYKMAEYYPALSTVKNIKKYQKIITDTKNKKLKIFYKSLKYNRKYTYLNQILDKFFGVN